MLNTSDQFFWITSMVFTRLSTFFVDFHIYYFDGLVQDCSNSISNAMELHQSCIKPSSCHEPKQTTSKLTGTLQGPHHERDGFSDHQPHGCLLKRLFRCRWKKTSKFCVTGLCKENSLVTGEFPAQRARNAENASIWWRHHEKWMND